ncbi:MAG: helix-hairpin-helix domain-containing protein [Chlorobiaceae bacterium]|nr:helix-hairpin-helix domain-containing protein [Chlorobiaceae bacterium]
MNFLEKLAIRLSLTKAEIYMVSILLGFLMLGVIMKNINSLENADLLVKKVENARYRDAEVDSLIQLATLEQTTLKEDVSKEVAAEEKVKAVEKKSKPPSSGKKVFAGTISFNKASNLQLQKIQGIGPVMAQRLITFRTEKGGKVEQFQDFLEVKGISNKKLEVLKQHFTLE